jgi:hypothetical protein
MYDVPMTTASATYTQGGNKYMSTSLGDKFNLGKTGIGIGAGIAAAMSAPWAAPLILLGGNILGSLFSRREQPQLTPEQAWFRDLTRFYSDLGKRAYAARTAANIMRLPAEKAETLGRYENFDTAWEDFGVPDSVAKKANAGTATATLYDQSDKKVEG